MSPNAADQLLYMLTCVDFMQVKGVGITVLSEFFYERFVFASDIAVLCVVYQYTSK